ncbi:MAG: O-antigen ligase family protein [Fibromonadales bacterium]|nr:O-antigen ligase family protein [Fibromonadales bacterium]
MVIKAHKVLYISFFLLILLSMLQAEEFTVSVAGVSLKFYHIFSLIFIPILFSCCISSLTLTVPPTIMCFYFLLIYSISALMMPFYGLGNPIAYMWGGFILVTICTIGKNIEFDTIISIFQKVAIIFLIMVWVKNFIYKEVFIIFFINPDVHPIIPTFSQGGVNLEATWIALFGFFFKSKKGYIYLFISLLISVLYTSRVGMILTFLCFCWLTYHIYLKDGLNTKRIFQASLIIFLLGIFFLSSPLADVTLNRIAESGNVEEAGTRGRMAMWVLFPEAFASNLMGYGAGNSMKAIEAFTSWSFIEPNIHNTYMQNALDFGLVGLLIYTTIVLLFLFKEIKTRFASPFAGVLLGYIAASLIQFSGSENLLFIIVGFYLIEKTMENYDINNNSGL